MHEQTTPLELPLRHTLAAGQEEVSSLRRPTSLDELTALAADLMLDAEDAVHALEYAAAASLVEGARSVLQNTGARLEWMARRIREAL